MNKYALTAFFLICLQIPIFAQLLQTENPPVMITGAMRNVMWKGELDDRIRLDTVERTRNLYGLGPASFLKGELMVFEGKVFLSEVTEDSAMTVRETHIVGAPFFVRSVVSEWKEMPLPSTVKNLPSLETFLDSLVGKVDFPFAFKLEGQVRYALIHVQNLQEGSKVSSPEDAHRGQVKYQLKEEETDILGFFSRNHQGVFTHHDTFIHTHLLSADNTKMGHLESADFQEMTLFLPSQIMDKVQ